MTVATPGLMTLANDTPVQFPERQFHVIHASEYQPARYADFGREWLSMGAQIVGGCCATGP